MGSGFSRFVSPAGQSFFLVGPSEKRRAITFSSDGSTQVFLGPANVSGTQFYFTLQPNFPVVTLTYGLHGSIVQGQWSAFSVATLNMGIMEALEE